MNAALAVACPLCDAGWGQPCTPEGDHMARWVAAYQDGIATREDMAAVFAAVPLIARTAIVPADARKAA